MGRSCVPPGVCSSERGVIGRIGLGVALAIVSIQGDVR